MRNIFSLLESVVAIILLNAQFVTANTDSAKVFYHQAFSEIKNMLEEKQPISFERAVFITENPYLNNKIKYEDFQQTISLHAYMIKKLMAVNDKSASMDFRAVVDFSKQKIDVSALEFTEKEKREMYRKALANWSIFTYLTDTTFIYDFAHLPFTYQYNDPFGMADWKNSQVTNLLFNENQQGNCFALVSLFKILSERLNSEAYICTAPQHIYIQHKDLKGDYYNVELATHTHPGDGSIQTLTYTFYDGIANGISLRRLKEQKQNVALCLVNLGKSYERKFSSKDDDFILQCAELALKYDTLNLNAMLLKEQVLEERVTKYAQKKNIMDINKLKIDKEIGSAYKKLENQIVNLYSLGYYPMPRYMQEMILAGLKNKNNQPILVQDRTPNPFPNTKNVAPEDRQYSTLSRGLFEEVKEKKKFEQYGHFTIDTERKKIVKMEAENYSEFLIDPVVFAWSVDPLAAKFPSWSPYVAFADNPIYFIDTDGRAVKPASSADAKAIEAFFDKGFTDKKGNTVDAADLFGVSPVYFRQKSGKEMRIYSSNLTPEQFYERLNNTKLSAEEKKYATAVYEKLSSKDVYELAVISTQNTAVGFNNPQERNKDEIKVQTDNPVSNEIFKVFENLDSDISTKQGILQKGLENKNYGYFPNMDENPNVKGLIIIYPQPSSSATTLSPGTDDEETGTNEIIKQGILNAPE